MLGISLAVLPIPGIDLKLPILGDSSQMFIFHNELLDHASHRRCFELMARHQSIDVNRLYESDNGEALCTLQSAFVWRALFGQEETFNDEGWLYKVEVLVNLGADPNLSGDDRPSAMAIAKMGWSENPDDHVWKAAIRFDGRGREQQSNTSPREHVRYVC